MDQNLAILLLMAFSIVGAIALVITSRWIRASNDPTTGASANLLAQENEALREKLGSLTDRLATLERIATDPAERTAREIEALRERDAERLS